VWVQKKKGELGKKKDNSGEIEIGGKTGGGDLLATHTSEATKDRAEKNGKKNVRPPQGGGGTYIEGDRGKLTVRQTWQSIYELGGTFSDWKQDGRHAGKILVTQKSLTNKNGHQTDGKRSMGGGAKRCEQTKGQQTRIRTVGTCDGWAPREGRQKQGPVSG